MSDVSPPDGNRGLQKVRDHYERQKKELKDRYEQEIESLREGYDHKINEEEKSGAAAVNHIQEHIQNNIDKTENLAQKTEKSVAERFDQKQEILKKREVSQNAYLEQAKKRYNDWAEGQTTDLETQSEKIKQKTALQLKDIGDWSNNRIDDAEKRVSDQGSMIREKGQERIQQLKTDYDKRSRDLESREENRYEASRNQHASQLEHENKTFKDTATKEKELHAQTITQLQENRAKAHKTLREKSYEQLSLERMQSKKRLHDQEEQNDFQLSDERDRFIKTESEVTTDHQQVLKNLQDKTNHEEHIQKTKLQRDLAMQKQDYDKQSGDLRARHQIQLDNQLKAETRERDTNQKGHEVLLKSQNEEFKKRFGQNETQARQAYSNQGLSLGRELINQKEKFLQASDKYSNKESDPFYQIRNNSAQFSETPGAYVLKAKVPEHEKDNIHVKVKGDRVILTGNRSFSDQVADGDHVISTSNVQTFHEHFDIPKKVKEADIMKSYENGVLTVVIPKVS